MADCLHHNFESEVKVFRLTNNEFENAEPTEFSAEVRIHCADCKQEFEFIGLSTVGFNCQHPTISADGKEIRLPIIPFNE
jgi:hypothetical protein